ncbi:hypothetical protein DEO72_LG3g1145 [Vigna unguiculata]|uniref:Nudix hydrolase domain-containing protein n=1 Tax=Vigna unguiculata TaxID=3917 RepID=A0A4D6LDE4_VIGUN|nr:hypothetical protein DEO72_LG3g1145 [Vigna unguiculata]
MTPKAPKAIGWDKLGPGSPLTTALRSKQQHTHGEDICVATVREVKEETWVDLEFVEVLAFM